VRVGIGTQRSSITVVFNLKILELTMSKLFCVMIVAIFAAVSVTSCAAYSGMASPAVRATKADAEATKADAAADRADEKADAAAGRAEVAASNAEARANAAAGRAEVAAGRADARAAQMNKRAAEANDAVK
jgi:hypothetical protein